MFSSKHSTENQLINPQRQLLQLYAKFKTNLKAYSKILVFKYHKIYSKCFDKVPLFLNRICSRVQSLNNTEYWIKILHYTKQCCFSKVCLALIFDIQATSVNFVVQTIWNDKIMMYYSENCHIPSVHLGYFEESIVYSASRKIQKNINTSH